MRTKQFHDGIYPDIDELTYHADTAISTSQYKYLAKTPQHFNAARNGELEFDRSPALEFGSLFHRLALEPERYEQTVMVRPPEFHDGRTKATKQFLSDCKKNGVSAIKEEDDYRLRSMLKSMKRNKDLNDLRNKGGIAEASVWSSKVVDGVTFRCRVDWLGDDGDVIDLKTCQAGGASAGGAASSIRKFRYDLQQANYTRILESIGYAVKSWTFVFIEKEAPFACSARTIAPESLKRSTHELECLDKVLVKCLQADDWPGYDAEGITPLNVWDAV